MPTQHTAPYGSWKSPITSDLIVSATVGLGQVVLDGDDIYWVEQRPTEGGRNVVVQRTSDGKMIDRTPAPFNARTRVHEYGGGAFVVHNGTLYFSNFADQRLYCQIGDAPPQPLTPEGNWRYADSVIDHTRGRLICVREDHSAEGQEAVNTIVSVGVATGENHVLVSGNDFYASPRLSPNGSQLAWLTWQHPNMPWDGTELWVGEIQADGSLGNTKRIAGGQEESIFQPAWSPDGGLYFVSDRTNWWNLYRFRNGHIEPLCEKAAEFGRPQWAFGMSTYAFASAERLICSYSENGIWHLASLDTQTKQLMEIETPYTDVSGIHFRCWGPCRAYCFWCGLSNPAAVHCPA